MFTYFLIGAALGTATGIPPGPVNLAVINAAYRTVLRRALAIGFGGMLGDVTYAALGILGIGPMLGRYPWLPPVLYLLTGVALVIYGFMNLRSRPQPEGPAGSAGDPPGAGDPASDDLVHPSVPRYPILGGLTTGLGLLLLNPSTILTWVVIVGSLMAGASQAEGIAAVIGIGAGSFGWFAIVACATCYSRRALGARTAWIPRIVGALLMAYGVFSIGRAAHSWLA